MNNQKNRHRHCRLAGTVLGVIALGMTATVSADPDWTAAPTYDTVTLSAGFSPDPSQIWLDAGGSSPVTSNLGPNCTGYIHQEAPDVDLNYIAGSYPLYIYVKSGGDTTLVVNAPDGRWYCNDDFMDLDPMVVFSNPASGMYNIWIGVHGSDELEDALLNISENNPSR